MKRDSKACRLAFHSRLENPHLDLFFQIPGKITLPTYELTEVARAPLHHALLRVGVARGPWRFFRAERKKDHRPHYWTYQGPMGKEYLHHIGYGECNGSVLTEVFFLRMALLQPFFSQKICIQMKFSSFLPSSKAEQKSPFVQNSFLQLAKGGVHGTGSPELGKNGFKRSPAGMGAG